MTECIRRQQVPVCLLVDYIPHPEQGQWFGTSRLQAVFRILPEVLRPPLPAHVAIVGSMALISWRVFW